MEIINTDLMRFDEIWCQQNFLGNKQCSLEFNLVQMIFKIIYKQKNKTATYTLMWEQFYKMSRKDLQEIVDKLKIEVLGSKRRLKCTQI